MAVALDDSVIRAINKFARTPMGRKYGRFAKKNYHMSGKKLMAKTVAGEAGGKGTGRAGVSSAGARGPAQFIPSTREAYISQYGVDPWKNDFSAMKGMAIHHMGTGVAGYNPGMPTYESYILGQKVDKGSINALRQGRAGGGKGRSRGGQRGGSAAGPGFSASLTETTNIPGIDNSGLRQDIRLGVLSQSPGVMPSQEELLGLAGQLQGTEDIPGATLTTRDSIRLPGRRRGPRRQKGGPRTVVSRGANFDVKKDGWKGARSVGIQLSRMALSEGLKVVSEKRDTVSTASGGVSDHYVGNKDSYAWDMSNSGSPSPQMDRAAMKIAKQLGAGKQWRKQNRSGVLNVTKKIEGRTYRFQMLYRTSTGGNHYNHIHLGIDRVDTAG